MSNEQEDVTPNELNLSSRSLYTLNSSTDAAVDYLALIVKAQDVPVKIRLEAVRILLSLATGQTL